MNVVELDTHILEVAERNYKVRKDLAREDWHYTYRHDSFAQSKDEQQNDSAIE